MDNPGQNKRDKTRVLFQTRVVVKTETLQFESSGNSQDISFKGISVKTDEKIPVGTPCDLEIELTGTIDRLCINAKGTVVRHTPDGIGISFETVDADSYTHLKKLLIYNADDPNALEEELSPR
jgi:hypothetical protein